MEAPDDEDVPESGRKKRCVRRAKKLKELPRVRIEHDIAPEQRTCACGAERQKIGEEITEEIEYVPASVVVHEHVRPKYACRACGEGVVIAPLPPRLIDGGLPGPGLVAQIVTAKYGDHLPLHRQEAIFERHGLDLSRQTMCDWVKVAAGLLGPIVQAMKRELLRRPVIHADDTPILMQTNASSKGSHKAFLWAWLPAEEDLIVYDFQLTRSQSVVDGFLEGFQGEVVVGDGFAGSNACERRGIQRAGCLAHARRYVREAIGAHPREASELIAYIQMLDLVERRATERGLDAAGRLELREQESERLVADLRSALDRIRPTILPSSLLGKAIDSTDRQWPYLTYFLRDGRVPIDNDSSERALRPVTVGRKNWLFTGSVAGGQRAAILYSLIQTCRRLGIEPFEYLRDVLSRVSMHPAQRIDELTPAGWKAARANAAAAPALG